MSFIGETMKKQGEFYREVNSKTEEEMTNGVILDDFVLVENEDETTNSITSDYNDEDFVVVSNNYANEVASAPRDKASADDFLPNICYQAPPAPPNSPTAPTLKPQTPACGVQQDFLLPAPKTSIYQRLTPEEIEQARESARNDPYENELFKELDRLIAESLSASVAKPLAYWAEKRREREAFDEVMFDIVGTKRVSTLLTGPEDDTIAGKKAPCEPQADDLVSSMEVELDRSIIGTTGSAGKYDRHMSSKGAKLMSLWLD